MKKHFPNKETYCGIVPPLITLMDENYQFDREAYEKEIAYVLEGGVNGLGAGYGDSPGMGESPPGAGVQRRYCPVNPGGN